MSDSSDSSDNDEQKQNEIAKVSKKKMADDDNGEEMVKPEADITFLSLVG